MMESGTAVSEADDGEVQHPEGILSPVEPQTPVAHPGGTPPFPLLGIGVGPLPEGFESDGLVDVVGSNQRRAGSSAHARDSRRHCRESRPVVRSPCEPGRASFAPSFGRNGSLERISGSRPRAGSTRVTDPWSGLRVSPEMEDLVWKTTLSGSRRLYGKEAPPPTPQSHTKENPRGGGGNPPPPPRPSPPRVWAPHHISLGTIHPPIEPS